MLGAKGDLQRLLRKVHAASAVKLHRGRIHMQQALIRRAEAGARFFHIVARFRSQNGEIQLAAARIRAEIKEHLAALAAFQIDENIDDRASVLHLAHIKRPLIALEEHLGEHVARIGKEVK